MGIRTVAAGLIVIATSALADDAAELARVEVVGSRVPRLDGETALPVQLIRREEIERSGVATTEELLKLVSANFGGTVEATSTANSGISGQSTASLRGLGGARTLVLLNGRRIENYAFRGRFNGAVDLHAIPLAAIERVEVLKDGASAIYGSDAIGGVVNFVTRREFAGIDAFASYTKTEEGGANSGRGTLTAGAGRLDADAYNAFGLIDVRKAERLRGSDRSYSQMPTRPELGVQDNDPRNWPANIRTRNPDGSLLITTPYLGPDCNATSYRVSNASGNACRFNFAAASDLLPSSRQVGFFGTGTLRLSGATQLYSEVLASQSLIRHEDPPAPVSTSSSQHGTQFVLPSTSPYYPTGVTLSNGKPLPANWSLAYRTVALGPETTEADSRNFRLLAGVRSQQWGWDVDAAASINRSWARDTYISGMVDAGKLSAAFATGLLNPFGPSGPEGDALLAGSELRGPARESTGWTQSIDLRGVRQVGELAGGPVGLAVGVEARRESLNDTQLPIAADVLDDIPAAPKAGSRRAYAAYAEIVAPVSKSLELQFAGRFDHYSDFGSAFSPKAALRFQPAPGVLLRASFDRGFRAPSLNELYSLQVHSTVELAIISPKLSDPVRCPVTHLASDCSPTVDIVTGGNPALQPQRSRQTNLGIVLEPAPGWMASLDLWRVYIDSNINIIPVSTIESNLAFYDNGINVKRGPVDPAFPNLPGPIVGIQSVNQNLGAWRVSGSDVTLQTAKAMTEVGRIWARVDATYVEYARQNISSTNVVDQLGATSPRWQAVASANLDRNAWVATLLYRYRQGYSDAILLPDGTPHHVASYQVWDAHAIFNVGRSVKLMFGVENLLNTAPPVSNVNEVGYYDPSYADPRGRRWTVGLRASWT